MKTDKSKWVEKLLSNAGFYLEQGSHRQAIEAFKEILKIDPQNPDALAGIKLAEKEGGKNTVNIKILAAVLAPLLIVTVSIFWWQFKSAGDNTAQGEHSGTIIAEEAVSMEASQPQDTTENILADSAEVTEPLIPNLAALKDQTEPTAVEAESVQVRLHLPEVSGSTIHETGESGTAPEIFDSTIQEAAESGTVEENLDSVRAKAIALERNANQARQNKAIKIAEELYRNGEYEKSAEKLNFALSGAPYQGENENARKLLARVEAAKKVRDEQIARSREAADTTKLKTAYDILENLPERNTPLVEGLLKEVLAMDRKPPQIVHIPAKNYKPRDPLIIRVTVRDNIRVKIVRLFYKRKDQADYKMDEKEFAGKEVFQFSISPENHKNKEINYYFSVEDISGIENIEGSKDQPLQIKVVDYLIQVP
jgi:tetratricopeptide (TPR) repeat protein